MENRMKKVGKVSSFLTKYIGVIIICFSVIAFFWRDGFAWTTSYTSVFLGVAMFGMGPAFSAIGVTPNCCHDVRAGSIVTYAES